MSSSTTRSDDNAMVRPAAASISGRSSIARTWLGPSKNSTLPLSSVMPKPWVNSTPGNRAIARLSTSTGMDEPP